MTDEYILKLALEYANLGINIKTIECPRGCLNPGLYFGYVAGAREILKQMTKLQEELEDYKFRYESCCK